MRTVFIATDFSKAAVNAAEYGATWADVFNAKIILFNAYNVPLSLPDSWVAINPAEVKSTAENYLKEQADELKKITTQPIQIMAMEGSPVDMILEATKNIKNVTIILGIKEEGKGVRKIFGSTITGLMKKTKHPVLVVPESIILKSLHTIALALDKDYECSETSIDTLKDMGKAFTSKVYIVKVISSNTSYVKELSLRSNRLLNKFKPLDIEYVFPKSKDISKALHDFLENHEINLLAVIPRQHTFFEKLFVKSETKKLIFHTSIPLLLLPEKNLRSIKSTQKLQHQQI